MDLTILERAKVNPRDVVIVDDTHTRWIAIRDEVYGWLRDQQIERGYDESSDSPNCVHLTESKYRDLWIAVMLFNGFRDQADRIRYVDADELLDSLDQGGAEHLRLITERYPFRPEWRDDGTRIRFVTDDGQELVGTLEDQEELSCEEDDPVYCVRLDDGSKIWFADVKQWRYEPSINADQPAVH
jgi:hypothetical protein